MSAFTQAIPFISEDNSNIDENKTFIYKNLEKFTYNFLKSRFPNIDEDNVVRELSYFTTYYLLTNKTNLSFNSFNGDNSEINDIVKDLWLKFKTQLETDKNKQIYSNDTTFILFRNMTAPTFILDLLKRVKEYFFETNEPVKTENNALSYGISNNIGDAFIVAFFKFVRGISVSELSEYLDRCWKNNMYDTGRLIFQTRDIRGGKGERKLFCECMAWLGINHTKYFRCLIPLFLEYGRGDDLYRTLGLIYDNNNSIDNKEKNIFLELLRYVNYEVDIILKRDLTQYFQNKPVSLMAKWFPSECSALNKKYGFYSRYCIQMGYTPKELRKEYLVPLRGYIDIVEKVLSLKQYDKLDKKYLSSIPSKAMLKLKKALMRHSLEWEEYINSLENKDGTAKINTAALFPHEIIKDLISSNEFNSWGNKTNNDLELIKSQWEQMMKDLRNNIAINEKNQDFFKNTLALCDTSSSMTGEPMNVSIAMGLILSRLSNDAFKNLIVTFETNPQFIKVPNSEDDIIRAVNFMCDHRRFSWGGSTNFGYVFTKLLEYATNYRYPSCHKIYPGKIGLAKEDMVKRIFVFSDMQFNEADDGNYHTNYESLSKKFINAGYDIPEIVFWNLRSGTKDFPVKPSQNGVCLMSGYSPTLIKNLLNGKEMSPQTIVMDTIRDERYNAVEYAMKNFDLLEPNVISL